MREQVHRDSTHVVVMAGKGGATWEPSDWAGVEAACEGYRFTYLEGDNRVDDPTEILSAAGVVVSAGGQNSIADLAVTHTPAILLPQPRPFIEQKLNARQVQRAGLAVVADSFPAPDKWPDLLRQAAALDPDWSRWETDGAARRAAEVIAQVARQTSQRIAIVSLADATRAAHLTHQVNLTPEGTEHITVALADAAALRKAVPKSTVVAGQRNLAAARNLGARTAMRTESSSLVSATTSPTSSTSPVNNYLSISMSTSSPSTVTWVSL